MSAMLHFKPCERCINGINTSKVIEKIDALQPLLGQNATCITFITMTCHYLMLYKKLSKHGVASLK